MYEQTAEFVSKEIRAYQMSLFLLKMGFENRNTSKQGAAGTVALKVRSSGTARLIRHKILRGPELAEHARTMEDKLLRAPRPSRALPLGPIHATAESFQLLLLHPPHGTGCWMLDAGCCSGGLGNVRVRWSIMEFV